LRAKSLDGGLWLFLLLLTVESFIKRASNSDIRVKAWDNSPLRCSICSLSVILSLKSMINSSLHQNIIAAEGGWIVTNDVYDCKRFKILEKNYRIFLF
jgi:hypothetical protein